MVLNMFEHSLFNQSAMNFPDSWNSGLVKSVFSSTGSGNTDVPVDLPQLRPINPFGTSALEQNPALPASLTNSDRILPLSKIFFLHF